MSDQPCDIVPLDIEELCKGIPDTPLSYEQIHDLKINDPIVVEIRGARALGVMQASEGEPQAALISRERRITNSIFGKHGQHGEYASVIGGGSNGQFILFRNHINNGDYRVYAHSPPFSICGECLRRFEGLDYLCQDCRLDKDLGQC